jgi:hypothetical protein
VTKRAKRPAARSNKRKPRRGKARARRAARPRTFEEVVGANLRGPFHVGGPPATAKRLRRGPAPITGEVVTYFQSDSSRMDSPVRVRHAQPGSPISARYVRVCRNTRARTAIKIAEQQSRHKLDPLPRVAKQE